MFKFLHAADIHLDSPMRGLNRYEGAPAAECRGATRRALENLVSLALAENVAFVLIVGDLYDGDWFDYNTGLFFSGQMVRLRDAGIAVYLVRGNHDAANKMTRELKPLDNVHILSDRAPVTIVHDNGAAVALHGQSYPRWDTTDNLALAYPGAVKGLFNIGLLHTAFEGREGHDRYAPCDLNDLRRLGYDYWALGHIHKRETLHAADPFVAFPGNVQGRSVRETGPKGCLLVTVDDQGSAKVETRWLDVMRWDVCQVDARGASDGDDLLSRFRERLVATLPALDGRASALRVEFAGPCPAHSPTSADWTRWSNEVRQTATEVSDGLVWVERVIARTSPPAAAVDPDDPDSPLAELSTLLNELKGDDALLKTWFERELDDLRKKGSWVFEGPEGSDSSEGLLESFDRMRELIDQVGPMLLGKLHG